MELANGILDLLIFTIIVIYAIGVVALVFHIWNTRNENGYATRDDDPRPKWEDQE